MKDLGDRRTIVSQNSGLQFVIRLAVQCHNIRLRTTAGSLCSIASHSEDAIRCFPRLPSANLPTEANGCRRRRGSFSQAPSTPH